MGVPISGWNISDPANSAQSSEVKPQSTFLGLQNVNLIDGVVNLETSPSTRFADSDGWNNLVPSTRTTVPLDMAPQREAKARDFNPAV